MSGLGGLADSVLNKNREIALSCFERAFFAVFKIQLGARSFTPFLGEASPTKIDDGKNRCPSSSLSAGGPRKQRGKVPYWGVGS